MFVAMDHRTVVWMDRRIRRIHGCNVGWTDGRMDELAGGWTDGEDEDG